MSDKSTHPVRRVWAEGKAAIAGWLSIPNSVSAEALAQLDWDTVVIDMQHGLFDFGDVVHILQAMQGTATMVRVPWNEPGLVMKVLDAGAVGVICPMISTRAECEQFVGACRYPPTGYRSFGPLRASGYYRAMAEYIETAQEQTLVFAMIETVEGMANIDAIASVPGLDGIYLGPSDLAMSAGVGVPGLDRGDGFILDAHKTMVAAARRHGIRAALNANAVDYAGQMIELGYDMVCLHSDLGLMQMAGQQILRDMRTHGRVRPGA